MAVKFKTRFRDVSKKDSKGFGKLYKPYDVAEFSKKLEKQLIEDEIASEYKEGDALNSAPADKNDPSEKEKAEALAAEKMTKEDKNGKPEKLQKK